MQITERAGDKQMQTQTGRHLSIDIRRHYSTGARAGLENPGQPYTCLDQERNGDEDWEDEHSAQTIEMQGPATRAIHQRNGHERHNNLCKNTVTHITHNLRSFDDGFSKPTIMAPMPIVANLALSSVNPELMNSDVE